MGNIFHKDFSAGYCPSDDFLNGRPNGLQRMDNLNLDQNGALSLVRVPTPIFDVLNDPGYLGLFPYFVYSKIFNGVVHRYVVLSNGAIIKDVNKANSYSTVVCTARSGYVPPGFGSGLGQVFIYNSAPAALLKDDGTTVRNWGIAAPNSFPSPVVNPGVSSWAGANVVFYTNFTAVEGTALTVVTIQATLTTAAAGGGIFRAILQSIHDEQYTNPSDGSNSTPEDEFRIQIKVPDSAAIVSFTWEFLLKTPTGSAGDLSDYFWYTWDSSDPAQYFRSGLNQWSTMKAKRKDFQREGSDNTLGWANVKAVRAVFNLSASGACSILGPHQFIGSENYPLFAGAGDVPTPYQYVQVNVYNNGAYTGKSKPSASTLPITVQNGSVTITPYSTGRDSQVNLYEIYKRGGTIDEYLLVGTTGIGGVVVDNKSDAFYIAQGVKLNTFLSPVTTIPNPIIAIEGPINGRMALLTKQNLYFTDYLNPEAYDTRMVITLSGNVGETNLFCARVGNSQLVVGTTQDIYDVSGTFSQLPDGSFDFDVTSLGIKQPPISDAHDISNNLLYYLANDGVRVLGGVSTQLISEELTSLWRGEPSATVNGFNIQGGNLVPYKLFIAKGRLVLLMYHRTDSTPPGYDGDTGAIYELDLVRKIWYRRTLSPPVFFLPVNFAVEEDGSVIMCGFDGKIWIHDDRYGYQPLLGFFPNTTLNFFFQTVAMDGGEPNSRKDFYTLKLNVATYGGYIDVYLVNEIGGVCYLGKYTTAPNQLQTQQIIIPLHGTTIDLSKRVALLLNSFVSGGAFQGVTWFKLSDWSIDYSARPSQELAIVEYPNNLGVDGRKIFYRLGIIIDTLGGNVAVTPSVDGVAQPTENFTSDGKSTFSYVFTAGAIGYDVSLLIQSIDGVTPFEYYGISLAESVTEKIPAPTNFLIISPNNFGLPALKRIRTLPFVINTRDNVVTFQPIIDGALVDRPLEFRTPYKKTLYYTFIEDAIGVDYGGIFKCQVDPDNPRNNRATKGLFEFFGFLQPTSVEEMPIPKMRDQIGPIQFDRYGRIFEFRVRLMARTSLINYNLIMDNGVTFSGSFVTTPNLDTVYTVKLNKKIMGQVCILEFSAPAETGDGQTNSFYRWHVQLRVRLSGMQTELKWIPAAGKVSAGI